MIFKKFRNLETLIIIVIDDVNIYTKFINENV